MQINIKTAHKFVLVRWLHFVGKFASARQLPTDEVVIKTLRDHTTIQEWTTVSIATFAGEIAVQFPQFRCKVKGHNYVSPQDKEAKRLAKQQKAADKMRPAIEHATRAMRIAADRLPPRAPSAAPFRILDRDPNFNPADYAPFMQSEAWRSVRYIALRLYGNHCKACGRGPKDGLKIHVDHIVACSRDWSRRLDITNLQVLCEECNMGKGGAFADDWR